ncbi:MAG: hypothetical protein NVS1B11_36090 [Terriglobales bacterium]
MARPNWTYKQRTWEGKFCRSSCCKAAESSVCIEEGAGFLRDAVRTFEEVIDRTKEALKGEGFGVLSEVAIHKALKDKLGLDVPRQVILGACNPQLAYRAMQIEPDVSLFLPCYVVVREFDGGVTVVAVDAEQMLASIDQPELHPVAMEANARLQKVIIIYADATIF